MNNLIKKMKPNPFVVVIICIVLATLTAYSVSIKKEVQINLYNIIKFKASD